MRRLLLVLREVLLFLLPRPRGAELGVMLSTVLSLPRPPSPAVPPALCRPELSVVLYRLRGLRPRTGEGEAKRPWSWLASWSCMGDVKRWFLSSMTVTDSEAVSPHVSHDSHELQATGRRRSTRLSSTTTTSMPPRELRREPPPAEALRPRRTWYGRGGSGVKQRSSWEQQGPSSEQQRSSCEQHRPSSSMRASRALWACLWASADRSSGVIR